MAYKVKRSCGECRKKYEYMSGECTDCPHCKARQTFEETYVCKDCDKDFFVLCDWESNDLVEGIQCECGSKNCEYKPKSLNFAFSNPVGTDRWTSGGMGHDYRHKWNMENRVEPERRAAEKSSKVGPNPYRDNSEEDFKRGMDKIHDLD